MTAVRPRVVTTNFGWLLWLRLHPYGPAVLSTRGLAVLGEGCRGALKLIPSGRFLLLAATFAPAEDLRPNPEHRITFGESILYLDPK